MNPSAAATTPAGDHEAPHRQRTVRPGATPRLRRTATGTQILDLGGGHRDAYGVTVAACAPDGDTRSFSRDGKPLDAFREICALIDRLGGEWRIVSVSTPATIFRDLQGTRRPLVPRRDSQIAKERMVTPEEYMLGKVGRTDLLPAKPIRGRVLPIRRVR